MPRDLRQLERRIEREMALLGRLADPPLPQAVLARVAAAVQREAARKRPGAVSRLRWASIAASVLLALGLGNLFRAAPLGPAEPGLVPAAELLKAWADAVERSTDRMAYLLESGGVPGDLSDDPLNGLLDSLDSSFDALEAL